MWHLSEEILNIKYLFLQMVSFSVNPFSSRDSFDIHGTVGGLTLTSLDGLVIPVYDLSEDIEVIFFFPVYLPPLRGFCWRQICLTSWWFSYICSSSIKPIVIAELRKIIAEKTKHSTSILYLSTSLHFLFFKLFALSSILLGDRSTFSTCPTALNFIKRWHKLQSKNIVSVLLSHVSGCNLF